MCSLYSPPKPAPEPTARPGSAGESLSCCQASSARRADVNLTCLQNVAFIHAELFFTAPNTETETVLGVVELGVCLHLLKGYLDDVWA